MHQMRRKWHHLSLTLNSDGMVQTVGETGSKRVESEQGQTSSNAEYEVREGPNASKTKNGEKLSPPHSVPVPVCLAI